MTETSGTFIEPGAGLDAPVETEHVTVPQAPKMAFDPRAKRYINLREASELVGVNMMTIRTHALKKNISGTQNPKTNEWSLDRDSVLEWGKDRGNNLPAGRQKPGPKKGTKPKHRNKSGAKNGPVETRYAPGREPAKATTSGSAPSGGVLMKGLTAVDAILTAFPDEEGAAMARTVLNRLSS